AGPGGGTALAGRGARRGAAGLLTLARRLLLLAASAFLLAVVDGGEHLDHVLGEEAHHPAALELARVQDDGVGAEVHLDLQDGLLHGRRCVLPDLQSSTPSEVLALQIYPGRSPPPKTCVTSSTIRYSPKARPVRVSGERAIPAGRYDEPL